MVNDNNHSKTAIYQYDFSEDGIKELSQKSFGKNWPVVYILNDKHRAYVGESSSVSQRMESHFNNTEKEGFKQVSVVYDERYNKSVILDLEATLIQMMQADQKYKLINRNAGQDLAHNYYQKKFYERENFPFVWELLQKKKLVKKDYDEIRNSDLFKYSPYHSLNEDQLRIVNMILMALEPVVSQVDKLRKKHKKEEITCRKSIFLKGGPGTGKTVVAITLLKMIVNAISRHHQQSFLMTEDEEELRRIKLPEDFKVALVVPQTNLRKTLQNVFKETEGLSKKMVIGPADVRHDFYDLLIVEESHRLKKRKALSNYSSFDRVNEELNLPKGSTELDWIMASSICQIFIYDAEQTVKSSDLDEESMKAIDSDSFTLTSQMRCAGGEDYIDYVARLFSNHSLDEKLDFYPDYDLRLFESFEDFSEALRKKEEEVGLTRMIAGYAWEWKTKKIAKKLYKIPKEERPYDFEIEGHPLIWNTVAQDWINSEHATEEVGCIHTTQGFDLNYAGVIIGPELTYNEETGKIEFIKENYYDKPNKQSDHLEDLVMNTYRVLMTRGIKGTFVYVCDEKLREYFKQYISVYQPD